MNLGLSYDQLTPVEGNVRAEIVAHDSRNPLHRKLLRKVAPLLLGSVAAVHGGTFSEQHMQALEQATGFKEIIVRYAVAATQVCSIPEVVGMATVVPTFGTAWDKDNNLKLYPVEHGEDMGVDKEQAKLFRELTRSATYPNGIGLGSWFMKEQIRQSIGNPNWVIGGRDNEHAPDNLPIIGLMDKFGAQRGTEQDSAVLQIDELTHDMKRRWGVDNIQTLALPANTLDSHQCPNNFLTHWSNGTGSQQIAVTYTKLPSILDNETVVWTKVKSHGDLPSGDMLKEVLASLLSTGSKEISDRQWGVPYNQSDAGVSHVFGSPVPVMHIHENKEPQILKALLEMEASHRKYGHSNMVSGEMSLKNMRDAEAVLGQKVPEATLVKGIDLGEAANEPYFNMVPKTRQHLRQTYALTVSALS